RADVEESNAQRQVQSGKDVASHIRLPVDQAKTRRMRSTGFVRHSFLTIGLAVAVKLVEGAARGKVNFLDLAPATEHLIDIDQADGRELILELDRHLFIVGAVAKFCCDPLTFFRVEEVEI